MPRKGKKSKLVPFEGLPWQTRLRVTLYDEDDCNAAIRGQKIPGALGLKIHRMGVISGIRHHDGFAHELRGLMPEFTRALNARAIMSGVIPDMNDLSEIPYCIWYPEAPPQDALRELVKRYPDMIYHAARACAVAGYFDLYLELQVLPEVHVAAEARDASLARNSKGSEAIYEHIMSKNVKFEVMNDYDRTVNLDSPRPASLNGDTAVFSDLTARISHSREGHNEGYYFRQTDHMDWHQSVYNTYKHFDITEDKGIGDHRCSAPAPLANFWPLLYSPLPADLPPINKDNLILAAAYLGDVDRYTRLRRPHQIRKEHNAVVCGIYQNPFWARWWSTQVPETPSGGNWVETDIRRAINARRIISDDITWVTPDTPSWLFPSAFWWPSVASRVTYVRLARKRPDLLSSCLRACIVGNYEDTWDELLTASSDEPNCSSQTCTKGSSNDTKLTRLSEIIHSDLYMEARDSSNPYFLEDIKSLGEAKVEDLKLYQSYYMERMPTAGSLYHRTSLGGEISKDGPFAFSTGIRDYDGMPEIPHNLGFTLFGTEAIASDENLKKAWERGDWLTVEDMYEILDAKEH